MSKRLQHIIEAQQFDLELQEDIFMSADEMKFDVQNGNCPVRGSGFLGIMPVFNGKIMVTLFYEPSSRTRGSFEIAMLKGGGSLTSTENAKDFSSAVKGESLEDSIRVFARYHPDVIVLRHSDDDSAKRAADVADSVMKHQQMPVSIINAGSGRGQHPTQALLDLYTIREQFGTIDGVSVAAVGDLANGRTIRSLAYMLGKYKGTSITFVAPPQLQIGEDILAYCRRHGIKVKQTSDFAKAITNVDVVYMTRIQKERMTPREYKKVKGAFSLTPELAETMRPGAFAIDSDDYDRKNHRKPMIMHPLPRVEDPAVTELHVDVDSDPRAKYFDQAENGLYVRMALLKEILRK